MKVILVVTSQHPAKAESHPWNGSNSKFGVSLSKGARIFFWFQPFLESNHNLRLWSFLRLPRFIFRYRHLLLILHNSIKICKHHSEWIYKKDQQNWKVSQILVSFPVSALLNYLMAWCQQLPHFSINDLQYWLIRQHITYQPAVLHCFWCLDPDQIHLRNKGHFGKIALKQIETTLPYLCCH